MEAALTNNFNSAMKNWKKATTAVAGGLKIAQQGANEVTHVVGETTFTVADSLGLTSTIEVNSFFQNLVLYILLIIEAIPLP
jgi:hypothetical protein